MRIFDVLTGRILKQRRARTRVTVLGVFLATVVMTCLLVLTSSLYSYLIDTYQEYSGNWYGAAYGTDYDTWKTADQSLDTEMTAGIYDLGYAEDGYGSNDYKPYVYIAGADEKTLKDLNIRLEEGRMAQNSNEIVMPASRSSGGRLQYHVGDTVELYTGRRISVNGEALDQNDPYENGEYITERSPKEYVITGLVERPNIESVVSPGATAFTVNEEVTASMTVFVRTRNPGKIQDFMENHFNKEQVSFQYNEEILSLQGYMDGSSLRNAVTGAVLLAIVFVVPGLAALIYNAFSVSVKNRMRQMAMLSSVGATSGQIKRITLKEGLRLSCVGIPCGVGAGILIMWWIIRVAGRRITEIASEIMGLGVYQDFHMTVDWKQLIIVMAVVFATTMLSVYLPASKAGKYTIIDVIRTGSEDAKAFVERSGRKRKLNSNNLANALAWRYYKRNRRKYVAPVISLSLSIILFVAAATLSGIMSKAVAQNYDLEEGYDISYTEQVKNGLPDVGNAWQNYVKMQNADGVTESTFDEIIYGTMEAAVPAEDGSHATEIREVPLTIVIMENSRFGEFTAENGISKRGIYCSRAVVSDKADDNSSVMIQYGEGEEETKIRVDLYRSSAPLPWGTGRYAGDRYIVMSTATAAQVIGSYETAVQLRQMNFSSDSPAATYDSLKKICKENAMDPHNLQNKTVEENAYINAVKLVRLFAYGFILLISLIAIANVINTIFTIVTTNRREIGLLQSLGLDRDSSDRLLWRECFIYGIHALIYGLPISAVVVIALNIATGNMGFDSYVPWSAVLISIVTVFAVVTVTMMYTMKKIRDTGLAEMMRMDNI